MHARAGVVFSAAYACAVAIFMRDAEQPAEGEGAEGAYPAAQLASDYQLMPAREEAAEEGTAGTS